MLRRREACRSLIVLQSQRFTQHILQMLFHDTVAIFFFYLTGDPNQGNDAGQGSDQDMDDGIIVVTLYGLCMASCYLSDSFSTASYCY